MTRRFATLALVALLGACASVPPPAPLDAAASAQALSARDLRDPALHAFVASVEPAASTGADWTPDRVALAAIWFDPVLATTRASAQRAAADAKANAERANPVLTLTPERIYHAATAGEVSPWTITLSLALQLLHPGEGAAKQRIAADEARAADWDVADAVWKTRSRALAALRASLLATRALALAQRAADADSAWLASAQRRLAAGEGDRTELLLAQDAATRAAAAVQARRLADTDARHALAAAIGVPAAALADVAFEWPGLDAPPRPDAMDASSLGATAASDRVDLRALLVRYDIAEAQLRAAAGARYPQLGVAPGYIYDRGDRKYSFGVDVEVPLFHGADARIASAAAARDEAVAKVRQRQSEILDALDRARAGYVSRYAAWRALGATRDVAFDAERQAAAALRIGSGDRPALLQAQARLAEADLAALDGLGGVLDGVAAIEDAVQRPLFPPSQLDLSSAAQHGVPPHADHD